MKAKKINIEKKIPLFIVVLILSFKNIFLEEICPKNKPILNSTDCSLKNCTNEQFNSKECIIANSIIKTQWLNNFRDFGEYAYRSISISLSSKGDMIVESTNDPKSSKRLFYGLKENGRPLFKNKTTDEDTPLYSINSPSSSGNYQLESYVIKLSGEHNDGKEYFFSLSKRSSLAEIFDFDNDKIESTDSKTFADGKYIFSHRQVIMPFDSSGDNFFYLIGIVGSTSSSSSSSSQIYLYKYKLQSFTNFEGEMTELKEISNGYGEDISCFTTSSEKIICFYLTKESDTIYFNLHKFNKDDFSNENVTKYISNYYEEKFYYKCIHLKDNIGVFSSFYQLEEIYPFFMFKEFKDDKFENYLNSSYVDSTIIIKKSDFLYSLAFNDLIKINDNKIAFVSASANREILYITTFYISREKKVRIRYYLIEIFALYSRKIYKDLRIHNYNNFITCGISYCKTGDCPDSSSIPHYSTLMIFSYPNSNDSTITLEEYIYNDNSLDLLNLKLNLTTQLTIENNIFGYILTSIKIVKIEGAPSEYKSFSSKIQSDEIREDYLMANDDYIIFKFTGGGKHIPKVNKQIEYYFIVTEPDYNTYESYTYDVEGESDQNDFERKEYIGKSSYYYIKSDNELSFDCSDSNCHICLKDHKEKCLSCLYNYNPSGDSYKECLEQEEPIIVETTLVITILTTTPTTEPITTILTTEPITTILTTEPITTIPTTELISTILTTEPITTIPTTELITKILTTEPIIESIAPISSIESIKIITTIITQKVDYKSEEITGKITEILILLYLKPKKINILLFIIKKKIN